MSLSKQSLAALKKEKEELVHLVSAALIKEPKFDDPKLVALLAATAAGGSGDVCGDAVSTGSDYSDGTSYDDYSSSEDPVTAGGAAPQKPMGIVESIVHHVCRICPEDGEFCLKLAVYLRDDLGIRGTANFITALCAYQPKCQPYLPPYLKKIIGIPSDWLQIASFARDMPMRLGTGLPTALRKALVASFTKFNEHSLAKYDKDGAQKARKKRKVATWLQENPGCDPEDFEDEEKYPYTLKQMIRMLHISQNSYYVMCLLGKRYPLTSSEFSKLGLDKPDLGGRPGQAQPRAFDEAKAGQRMRLAIPTTWETQLASRGNTASVWDELVSSKQLPFMAMLRNLRNIILAGCGDATHKIITDRLTSEDQIAGSRQFPYRFFSAYDALDIDLTTVYKTQQEIDQMKMDAKAGRGRGGGRGGGRGRGAGAPASNRPEDKPRLKPESPPTEAILQKYRQALDRAVQLATSLNIRPIHGRTLVFASINSDVFQPVKAQGSKGIGSVRSIVEIAILLALMFKYACEDCELILYGETAGNFVTIGNEYKAKGILENMKKMAEICETIKETDASGGKKKAAPKGATVSTAVSDLDGPYFPYEVLDKYIDGNMETSAVVVVDTKHHDYSSGNVHPTRGDLPHYLRKMRYSCNEDLLYVAVNVAAGPGMGNAVTAFCHPNDVLMTGFSDAILRFVAERGAGGPLKYIERIDEVKRIDTSEVRLTQGGVAGSELLADEGISSDDESCSDAGRSDGPFSLDEYGAGGGGRKKKEKSDAELFDWSSDDDATESEAYTDYGTEMTASSISTDLPGGPTSPTNGVHEFRFFISSTFLDMQNERQALLSEVFPTLRKMCLHHGIKAHIVELDLRWGITEEEVAHGLTLSTCLNEVARCKPYFLSLIGNRSGWKPSAQDIKKLEAVEDVYEDNFDWLESLPQNTQPISVTEMEYRQACESRKLCSGTRRQIPFLSFHRDGNITNNTVPPAHKKTFSSESDDAAKAVNAFKKNLRDEAARNPHLLKVVKYSAAFDKEVITGMGTTRKYCQLNMSEFKARALRELWKLILTETGGETSVGDSHPVVSDAEDQAQRYYELQSGKTFAGRKDLLKQLNRFICGVALGDNVSTSNPGLLALTSTEGCGKSTIMAALKEVVSSSHHGTICVSHFFGAGDGLPSTAAHRIGSQLVSNLGLEEDFVVPTDMDSLATVLPNIYAAASKRARVVVLLDGIDTGATNLETMLAALPTLIPAAIPLNCKFVVSVRSEQGSTILQALKIRKPGATVLPIPQLGIPERAQVIRNHLKVFGRKLQESAKGNQLVPLLRKQDAGKPTYLVRVLTFLRLFATYDTLNAQIRAVPTTTAALDVELIKRLEQKHSPALSKTVLTALYFSDALGGMEEADLYRLVPGKVAQVRNLLYTLDELLFWQEGVVKILSASLKSCVQKAYIKTSLEGEALHKGLATNYMAQVSTQEEQPVVVKQQGSRTNVPKKTDAETHAEEYQAAFDQLTPRAKLCVLFHSFHGKQNALVQAVATHVGNLESLVRAGLLPQLLFIAAQIQLINIPLYKRIEPFMSFLILHRHVLLRHSSLTLQCAMNMPGTHPVKQSISKIGGNAALNQKLDTSAWMGWFNRAEHGEAECTQTDVLTSQPVLCVAFDEKASLMALGGRDWICRVVRQVDGVVTQKLRHPSDVTAACFLSTKLLATGCEDGLVRIWSLIDGAVVQQGRGHTRRVNTLSLHPKANSLLSACDDATARLWNLEGSQRDLRFIKVFRRHKGPVSCGAIHSSGHVYATGSWDGAVCFWGLDKEKKDLWFNPRSGAIRSLAFVPSMVVTVAVATYDGRIHLYDQQSEQHTISMDHHYRVPVAKVDFSPDGQTMLSADAAGVLKLWRAGVVGQVLGSLSGHHRGIPAAKFHPTKKNAVTTASLDATARHWQLEDQQDSHVGAVHAAPVTDCVFAKNGQFYITSSRDHTAKFVDLSDPSRRCVLFTMDHPDTVGCVTLNTDETKILTGCHDGKVRVWRLTPGLKGNDGSLITEIAAHDTPVREILTNNLGTSYSVGSSWDIAKLDLTSGRCYQRSGGAKAEPRIHGEPLAACVFQSSVLVYHAKGVHTVSTYGGRNQLPPSQKSQVAWNVLCCATSGSDAPLIASGRADGTLTVFDSDTGETTSTTLKDDLRPGHSAGTPVNCVAFYTCPRSGTERIIVGCGDYSVRILSRSTLSLIHIFYATSPVTSIAASTTTGTNSNQLVAGDSLGNVYYMHIHDKPPGTGYGTVEEEMLFADDDAVGETTHVDPFHGHHTSHAPPQRSDSLLFGQESTDTQSVTTGTTHQQSTLPPHEVELQRFAIITQGVPHHVKGQERKQWFLKQKEVLKQAMKEQKTNAIARLALRAHAQKTAQVFGVFQKLEIN